MVNLLNSTGTSIQISYFDSEDIKKTLSLIPGDLKSLRGATKFHEILVNPSGKIMVKELPTDETYGTVNISFKKNNTRTIEEPVARMDDE